jgi:hypothetical protein
MLAADGETPIGNADVGIKAGSKVTHFTTDAQGEFTVLLAAGTHFSFQVNRKLVDASLQLLDSNGTPMGNESFAVAEFGINFPSNVVPNKPITVTITKMTCELITLLAIQMKVKRFR